MATTITLPHATQAYHSRFAPAGAKKAYTARIRGRAAGRLRFDREFLGGPDEAVIADEPGLYEIRSADKKGRADDIMRLVVEVDGDLVALRVHGDHADGMAADAAALTIAKALDAGTDLADMIELVQVGDSTKYRIRSAAKAKKAAAAATVDAAVAACMAVVGDLSPADRKKVLAELRKRLTSPPAPKAGAPTIEDSVATYGALELDGPR